MRKKITLLLFSLVATTSLLAQTFGISAELRPRFENRHGYKTILKKNTDGANFVSQRTRLNFKFQQQKVKLGVSVQNVRVWGDVSTLSKNDNNYALHEAWAEALLSEKFSIKVGRQEIVYDDHRIFGSVGWAQQARSHDALLAKFKLSNTSKLDLGFALNANKETLTDELYALNQYKTFQYAWYHTNIDKIGLSLLLLNNGVEYMKDASQKVDYSQTIGGRVTFAEGAFNADAAAYFQTGKVKDTKVGASYFGGNIKYKASPNFVFGLGAEYLSGKDTNATNSKIESFMPLYGTNHKFNGWMDYFYVGNHVNSVGLVDINATVAYKKDKFSAKLIPHFFSSAADIYNGNTKMDNSLGTEIDFTVGYKMSKQLNFSAGYSKMFAKKSLEYLKGSINPNDNNSWAWLMITFKPTLFKTK